VLKQKPNDTVFHLGSIRQGKSASPDRQLGMSSIAWAESLCDPVARHDIALANRIVRDRRPFTDEEAVLAARLFPIFGPSH
jgi:hypothetical protein